MKKNVASQAVGCQMISATDGSAFTGSVTVSVTGDAGTQATGSVGSGACTHEGNGYHTYAPSQAETNYDLVAFTFTGTGAIPATIQIYTRPATGLLAPATAGRTVVVDASGLVDANTVKVGPTGSGTAQTARDLGASVLLSSGTGPGQLDFTSGVVKANVTQYGGSAGTFASGRPEVNTTHISGSAVSTSSAQIGVNVVNFGGSAGTFAAGRPEVNMTHIKGTSSAGTAGYAGIDWSAVNAPTSVVGLTGTTISTGQTITSVSDAVGSVTGNVGGNVTGSVGSIATGGISAASFAAGAIDAAAIAANAIGASELAADAVAEIADAVWDEATLGHTTADTFGGNVTEAHTQIDQIQTAFEVDGDVYRLTANACGNILYGALTETYAADGSAATLTQLLYMVFSVVSQFGISGTTLTCKKLDGSTTAMTFTLDDATNPTARTRAT